MISMISIEFHDFQCRQLKSVEYSMFYKGILHAPEAWKPWISMISIDFHDFHGFLAPGSRKC